MKVWQSPTLADRLVLDVRAIERHCESVEISGGLEGSTSDEHEQEQSLPCQKSTRQSTHKPVMSQAPQC